MHKSKIELKRHLPFVLLFTLLVGCDTPDTDLVPPTAPPVPATVTAAPANINISRKDYEAAHSKWQSQGIDEYVVEVAEIPHASGIEEEESVLYYVRRPYWGAVSKTWPTSGVIAPPANLPKSEYPDPITSLFAKIDQALRFVESEGQAPYVYTVAFDPTLGYPSSYEEYCSEDVPPRPRYCPTDSYTRQRVVRLEVLKRRQP